MLIRFLLTSAAVLASTAAATISSGIVTSLGSATMTTVPDGLFFDDTEKMLHVLSTPTQNEAAYIYVYAWDDTEDTKIQSSTMLCKITIPADRGFSKLVAMTLYDSKAYFVDQLGPEAKTLDSVTAVQGSSVLSAAWSSHPCGCSGYSATSKVSCTSSVKTWADLSLTAVSTNADAYKTNTYSDRLSDIVVIDDSFFAVNSYGLHATILQDSTISVYPKSVFTATFLAPNTVTDSWPFTATTVGSDVNLRGLTCGHDECAEVLYIVDEWLNLVFELVVSSSNAVTVNWKWDLSSLAGTTTDAATNLEDGLISIAYEPTAYVFWVGFGGTKAVHAVYLTYAALPQEGFVIAHGSVTATTIPDGLFFDAVEKMLYVLSSPTAGSEAYIYVYLWDASTEADLATSAACKITIPTSFGIHKLSGMELHDSKVYLTDELGVEAKDLSSSGTANGNNLFTGTWVHPCGCAGYPANKAVVCTSTTATWAITLTGSKIAVDVVTGSSTYDRVSDIIVVGANFLTVNSYGIHSTLTASGNLFPKSISKQTILAPTTSTANWEFDDSILLHLFNLKGLSCGSGACAKNLYIVDEVINAVYEMTLTVADPITITYVWDLSDLAGTTTDDATELYDGLISITYEAVADIFWVGFGSKKIQAVSLAYTTPAPDDTTATDDTPAPGTPAPDTDGSAQVAAGTVTMAAFMALCLMSMA